MVFSSPFLSIIIPIYNAEAYIDRCLDSISCQEDLFAYEIICVDNNSTDRSLSIVHERAADLPITIIQEEKQSASAARNAGLRAASGDRIWFVDADDEIAKDAFRRIKEKVGGETSIDVFGASVLNEREDLVLTDVISSDNSYRGDCLYAFYAESASKPFIWNSIYKRSFLESGEMRFPERCKTAEDVVFQFGCFEKASVVAFHTENIYVYHYLQNAMSLMHSVIENESARLADCVEAVSLIEIKRRKDYLEKEFGQWVFDYLLYPILKVENGQDRAHLMRTCYDKVLKGNKVDFSSIKRKDRLKCRLFKPSVLSLLYSAFRRIK